MQNVVNLETIRHMCTRSAHTYRKAKPETICHCRYFDYTKICRIFVISTSAFLGFEEARTRKISPRLHENLNNEIFVPSRVKVSLFRLECVVFSCLRRNAKVEITTNRYVFVSSPFETRKHEMAENSHHMIVIGRYNNAPSQHIYSFVFFRPL
jgi:hypothetical protein